MLTIDKIFTTALIDIIVINLGVLLSMYIKFFGNIPVYNFDGYQGLWIFISISYFISIFVSGLYKKQENLSYYSIIKNSFKTVIIASLLIAGFGYFFRGGRAIAFPISVLIISVFINYIFLLILRFISKLYDTNVEIFNKLVAFLLNRISEIIIICVSIYLSYLLKFRTFDLPKYNFSPFPYAAAILSFSYCIFIYKFLLYKYSREQSNFSVFYVMIKTTISVLVLSSALLFVFKNHTIGFPSSVLFLTLIFNYFLLSFWHILIRKNFISEVKDDDVDLNAIEDDYTIEEDEEAEVLPEQDGFNIFWWSFYKVNKFSDSIKKYGKDLLNSGIILFLVSWWMIATYMCFMPEYIRNFFKILHLGSNPDNYYLYNFRIFVIVIGTFYILWMLLNTLFLIKSKKQEISRYWSGSFYLYAWNLILFLIVIILGCFLGKLSLIISSIIFSIWLFITKTKMISKVFDINIKKSFIVNLVNLIIVILIYSSVLFFIYK